jgi:integrase
MKIASNTFGVFFYLRKYKAVDGLAPIYARITVDGKRADVSVKRNINEKNWCGTRGLAKGNKEETLSLNIFLEQLRSEFVATYQKMLLSKKLITAQAIKKAFLGGEQKEQTLCKLVDYHNNHLKDTLSHGTLKNYGATAKYLDRFLKDFYQTDDIYLSHISYKFIIDFEYFLRTSPPLSPKNPLTNNGLMKHLERFKKLMTLALQMEWIEKDPIDRFKLKFKKVERGFLSKEELTVIENCELQSRRLQCTRDLFVFSCYTGIAYIDVMGLRSGNITKGIDGEYWIYTERKKTGNSVRVPLLPKAMKIVKKYLNDPETQDSGFLLPQISNQKLNDYLKEIGTLCKSSRPLTFHLARHTFATTVTLTNGVPIETVSKMLGHSSIRTTQIYAKVIEKKVSEDMIKLKDRLSDNSVTDELTKVL